MGALFGFGATTFVDYPFLYYFSTGKWVLLVSVLLCAPVFPWLKRKLSISASVESAARSVALLVIFVLSVLVSIRSTYNPFIYFNF